MRGLVQKFFLPDSAVLERLAEYMMGQFLQPQPSNNIVNILDVNGVPPTTSLLLSLFSTDSLHRGCPRPSAALISMNPPADKRSKAQIHERHNVVRVACDVEQVVRRDAEIAKKHDSPKKPDYMFLPVISTQLFT